MSHVSVTAIEAKRQIVEDAGAEYVSEREGVVRFRDRESGVVLRLYAHALRSAEDVRLALKSVREPVVGFEPLSK